MKSPLASLLAAALATPVWALDAAKSPKIDLAKSYDPCNMVVLNKAAKETDATKAFKALGDFGDPDKKTVRLPAIDKDAGTPGVAGSNPLCQGWVWKLVKSNEPGKSLFAGTDVIAQVKHLQLIDKEYVTLDKNIQAYIAESKKILKLGENVGLVTIKEEDYEPLKRPGPGTDAVGKGDKEKVFRPTMVTPAIAKDKAKLSGDALSAHGLALVSDINDKTKQGEDNIIIGARVVEWEASLGKARAALKTYAGKVATDLNTGVTDEKPATPLTLAGLRKELDNFAVGRKKWADTTEASGPLAVAYFDNIGNWCSVYGNSVFDVVLAADALFVGRGAQGQPGAPGGNPANPNQPKPGANLDVEKFRNAFETKALQDIGAGAGGLPQNIDREDLKTAKAYTRGDKIILVTDKGLKIGETPIPASLGDGQTSEGAGTDAATAVAAKFLKGDNAGAQGQALKESLIPTTPANVPGSAGAVAGASEVQQGAGSAGCGDKRSTADRYAANQTEACGEQGKSNVVERKKLAEEIEQKKKDCDSDPFKKSQAAACKAQVDVDYKPRFEAMDSGKETVARKTCVATADSKVQEYLFTEILNQAQSLQGDYKGGRADSLATEAGIPGKGKYLSGPVDGYFNTKWAGEEGKKSVVACSGKLKPSATAKTTEPSKENVDKLCVHDDLVAAIKASLSAVGSAEAAPLPSGAGDAGGYIDKETKFKPK